MNLFGDDAPARPKRQRDRTGKAHKCPSCHRRTYRRVRRYPEQGYVDARCASCVALGVWPEQSGDRRNTRA